MKSTPAVTSLQQRTGHPPLEAGDEVVALGNVRRRFFRAGATTASRVEISATAVARATDKRAIKRTQRLALAAAESITSVATSDR